MVVLELPADNETLSTDNETSSETVPDESNNLSGEEAPILETPIVETPVIETPGEETPAQETSPDTASDEVSTESPRTYWKYNKVFLDYFLALTGRVVEGP